MAWMVKSLKVEPLRLVRLGRVQKAIEVVEDKVEVEEDGVFIKHCSEDKT
jgi:hypothetical protein